LEQRAVRAAAEASLARHATRTRTASVGDRRRIMQGRERTRDRPNGWPPPDVKEFRPSIAACTGPLLEELADENCGAVGSIGLDGPVARRPAGLLSYRRRDRVRSRPVEVHASTRDPPRSSRGGDARGRSARSGAEEGSRERAPVGSELHRRGEPAFDHGKIGRTKGVFAFVATSPPPSVRGPLSISAGPRAISGSQVRSRLGPFDDFCDSAMTSAAGTSGRLRLRSFGCWHHDDLHTARCCPRSDDVDGDSVVTPANPSVTGARRTTVAPRGEIGPYCALHAGPQEVVRLRRAGA
jgi:hypothetical protein